MTLAEVAALVDGKLSGDPTAEITGVESLVRARSKHAAFFIDGPQRQRFTVCRAGVVLVKPGTAWPEKVGALIEVADPDEAFTKLYCHMLPLAARPAPGVHATAVVAATATVHPTAYLGPYVVVGEGASVGENCVIHSHCVLMEGVSVGARTFMYPHCVIREFVSMGADCLLQPGAVVGGDGFGYKVKDGGLKQVPQRGTVELGDDVHLGCNTTVDRARFGKTSIGRGTKIDNLVQVGHNVTIGNTCGIAALTGIAGSATIEDFVQIGGDAAISNEVTIGSGSKLLGRCGVDRDIEPNSTVYWSPARGAKETYRLFALFDRLPEIAKTVKRLEERMAELEQQGKHKSHGA